MWENVPGVLTSGKGGDFAGFLSLLAGWEVPIPDGGWQRAGIVTPTPGCYGVAWRVLDAQYTRVPEFPGAVPQRRRRVILVGHLGSWEYPAKVLFDGEMCGGTDAPRREAGQGSAEDTQGRAPRAHTVRMRAGKPGGGKGALVSEELSLTLQTGNDQTLFQFPCWWDGSQQSATITASSDHQFMPDKQQLQSVIDMRQIDTGDGVSPALLSTDYKGGKAICDEVCPTLDANYPAKMNRQDAGKLVQEVYAFDSMASHAMDSPISDARHARPRRTRIHADGLWGRCSLFFFTDPVDITILVVALERQRVVRPLWYNAYRWRRGFRRGKVDERAFM